MDRPGNALGPRASNAGLFNLVNLVNKLEAEARNGNQGRMADRLSLGDAKTTKARLDRLTHHGEIVEAGNESWRFKNRA